MALILSDKEVKKLKKNNFGLSYDQFLHLVCDGCRHPCWLGEEHCEKLERMSEEFGFR
jgi:hypothetical protein